VVFSLEGIGVFVIRYVHETYKGGIMKQDPDKSVAKIVDKLLDSDFWIPELKTMQYYSRVHDDTDGDSTQQVNVIISPDGDVHIGTDHPHHDLLRYRTMGGGGNSKRTRTALMILARAIQLDNESEHQK
jgi:hypothetical protein